MAIAVFLLLLASINLYQPEYGTGWAAGKDEVGIRKTIGEQPGPARLAVSGGDHADDGFGAGAVGLAGSEIYSSFFRGSFQRECTSICSNLIYGCLRLRW